MIKWLNFALLGACVVALTSVYLIKYKTVDIANEKIALERVVDRQASDLSILKADWAYLNQPSYIEPIILRHKEILGLEIISQAQFVSIEDLPMRVAKNVDNAALDALFEAIEKGVDPISVLIEANSQ